MKKILIIIMLAISLAVPAQADFKAGFNAYLKGDYKTAFQELAPEARKGDPKAQFALGLLYQGGKGVEQNYTQAYMWYGLAEAQGHKIAPRNKKQVASKMPPGEIQIAEEMISKFKPSIPETTVLVAQNATEPTQPKTEPAQAPNAVEPSVAPEALAKVQAPEPGKEAQAPSEPSPAPESQIKTQAPAPETQQVVAVPQVPQEPLKELEAALDTHAQKTAEHSNTLKMAPEAPSPAQAQDILKPTEALIKMPSALASKLTHSKTGIADIAPSATDFLLSFSSWSVTHKAFSMTDSSILGFPVKPIDQIKSVFGFNPLDLGALKAHGVDIEREFGIAVTGLVFGGKKELENLNLLFLIPVNNGQKAMETIISISEKGPRKPEVIREGQMIIFRPPGNPKEALYMALANSYLLFGTNPFEDAKFFMQSVLSGQTSLSKSDAYKNVAHKSGSGKGIFAYSNTGRLLGENFEAAAYDLAASLGKALNLFNIPGVMSHAKEIDGLSCFLDLESPDFMLSGTVGFKPGSKLFQAFQGAGGNNNPLLGYPDTPGLILSTGLNFSQLHGILMGIFGAGEIQNYKALEQAFKAEFGIDPEKELINNLQGGLSLSVFPSTGLNGLITVGVKDETMMEGLLDKLMNAVSGQKNMANMLAKESVAGTGAYIIKGAPVQMCIGVKDHNLIAATGRETFEKAVSGNAAKGFLAKMNDPALEGALKGSGNLLYINIKEALSLAMGYQQLIRALSKGQFSVNENVQKEIGKQISHVLASVTPQGNSLSLDLKVKTTFKDPLFAAVGKLVESYNSYTYRAKASEAKVLLDAIRTNNEVYFAEHNAYTDDLSKLGNPEAGGVNYSYSMELTNNGKGFVVTATPSQAGKMEGLKGTWTLDNNGVLGGTAVTSGDNF